MTRGTANWLLDAASLPVAFSQVREDPTLDFWILDQIGRRARIALVASGGCTVAALATRTDVEALHFVDPNPAQIALSRFKLHLLQTADPDDRLRLLGHAFLDANTRATRLAELLGRLELAADVFGPPSRIAACGPDHAGRYEHLFAALREELQEFEQALKALLRLDDPQEQARRVQPDTRLGRALDDALTKVMALPNLVTLFGVAATRNPRQAFASHFATRLRLVLAKQPAAGNPFLSQMLLGRFTSGAEYFWLRSPILDSMPALSWEESSIASVLRRRQGEFDMVHLSNILDWLDPDEAKETLDYARAALRPGGWVIVRQLNSVLDIPTLGEGFAWKTDAGAALLERDRSFFYRAICVGQRK